MDLLCFSHLRWTFVYQRPNHLMERCARERRVFFIEEPIETSEQRARMVTRRGPHQLIVCTPHVPHHLAVHEQRQTQRRLLQRLIVEHAITPDVLWFYTPMALHVASGLSARVVIYDCMDELSAFMGAPEELAGMERRLLQRANLVFTGGPSLFAAKRERHAHVHAFASSVDAEHFEARPELRDPIDQQEIAHPRIGYYGVIDERIDLALIARVAAQRPDWQLVMVGPIAKIDPAALPRAPNIHWLGQKAYAALPHYLAGWDVAWMPFSLNAATRFISPTKTLEYLAAGKRVVATAVHDVVHPHADQGVVDILDHSDAVGVLARALDTFDAERARRAAELVTNTSWDRTWAAMYALVAAAGARTSDADRRHVAARESARV